MSIPTAAVSSALRAAGRAEFKAFKKNVPVLRGRFFIPHPMQEAGKIEPRCSGRLLSDAGKAGRGEAVKNGGFPGPSARKGTLGLSGKTSFAFTPPEKYDTVSRLEREEPCLCPN